MNLVVGVKDIQVLLKEMKPTLDRAEFVYSTIAGFKFDERILALNPVATILESEGMTVVVPKDKADACGLAYDLILCKISLTVHSSLEAVGLTAAISTELASHNISANVVAGYYHDHIFIPKDQAKLAMEVLNGLSGKK